MEKITQEEIVSAIQAAKKITFLTGAGVSTPSGIPDYRSLQGVYHGIERPEYLLSHSALLHEPQKFYDFIKNLYHPDALPNAIHTVMAELEKLKETWVISQNIDQMHRKAGSKNVVDFHGNLYDCYCMKCGQSVAWEDYLHNDRHENCGGQIRPNVVLYEEGFQDEVINQALSAVRQADLLVVVGTTFQVYPFASLVDYREASAKVIGINQTRIENPAIQYFYQGDALAVFEGIHAALAQ